MATKDRGPEVAAVAILFLTLAWIFVTLRCYVRAAMMKSFGMDDWLAVAALVLFSLYCTLVFKGVQYGSGQHIINIPPANVPIAQKRWWCCELAYIAATAGFKISICIFLARICVTRTQIMTIWIVGVVVVIFSTVYLFIAIFQCSPVTYFWTQYLGASGNCLKPSVITGTSYAHAAVSCWAYWTLGILPVSLVWNLSMNIRTKISVTLILALGAFGSTATIVRISFLKQLSQGDFLHATTDVAIWSTIEPGIGIIASAKVTLRPLFRTFLSRSKFFGSARRNRDVSSPWPILGRANHQGYLKIGHGVRDGQEELGLRNDIVKGAGVTTTIKSIRSRDLGGDREGGRSGMIRTMSREGLKWLDSETPLKDDISEEGILPARVPAGFDWVVRKTTWVTTSQELRNGKTGR